jgi:hypothetical protein
MLRELVLALGLVLPLLVPQSVVSAEKQLPPPGESAGRFLIELFLQGDVPADVAETLLKTAAPAAADPSRRLRWFAHTIVTLSEFQLD